MPNTKSSDNNNYYEKKTRARAELMEIINNTKFEGFVSNQFNKYAQDSVTDQIRSNKDNSIDEESSNSIVNTRLGIWKDAWKEWEGRYNSQTNQVVQMNNRLKREHDFKQNQANEQDRNNLKLSFLENDIVTLRKQLEISENEFKHKSYYLYFLKNTFVALLSTLLVIFLVSQNLLASKTGTQLQISIAIILGINILYNVYLNRNRHSSIFTKQNWSLTLPPKEDTLI